MANYKFENNDFVFARRPGYSFWPARITNVENSRYLVHFYGNTDSRLVKENELYPYDKYKYEFCTKSRSNDENFCNAVEQINTSIIQYNAIAKLNQTNKYVNIVFDESDKDDDDDDDEYDGDNNENSNNQENEEKAVQLKNNFELKKIKFGNVEVSDEKAKFHMKEKDMLLIYKRIFESLFQNEPKFNKTLKQLRILKDFQIHIDFLMLIKTPVFLNNLDRVCNYNINDDYLKKQSIEKQLKISKKIQKMKSEAEEIIKMLKGRLSKNLPKNKSFDNFYKEETQIFEDITKDMPFKSKMLMTSQEYMELRKTKKK